MGFNLQCEIFFGILGEIGLLGLRWDPFIGIVTELPALDIGADNTPLAAKDCVFIKGSAMDTIQAGFFDFLSEQHRLSSFLL